MISDYQHYYLPPSWQNAVLITGVKRSCNADNTIELTSRVKVRENI